MNLHRAAIVIAIILSVNCMAQHRELRDGKLFVDGKWTFLKIGKPLRNFADAGEVDQLIRDLPRYRGKITTVWS